MGDSTCRIRGLSRDVISALDLYKPAVSKDGIPTSPTSLPAITLEQLLPLALVRF